MKNDIDKELYDSYLNGNKEAFEYLYNKYKNKLQYFIYNIVKDYQKAEDLTQETFIYVMQNKMQENNSFKYYIYLVAKSKSYNYVNVEKRRNEINEIYLSNECEKVSKDILEVIIDEETKKELLEAINQLDEKYKNTIYLISIENLTYEETAKILGQTLSNTKTLVHRGKLQLRKILIKKGFKDVNKMSKIILIILCASIILSGISYAIIKIYQNNIQNVKITPTYTSEISSIDENKIWVRNF